MRSSRVLCCAFFFLCSCIGALGRSRPHAEPDRDGGAIATDARTSSPDPIQPSDPVEGERDAASVFFVGHSLINFDMPAMLDGVADSAGVDHEFGAHVGIGASLSWIWNNPTRGEGGNPHTELPSGRYDVLVMTEAIPLVDQVEYNDTVGYAGRFYDLAIEGDAGTQVYFYETWHSLDGGYDWRARIDSDRALWERVVDQVNGAKGGPDMLLVPGGSALGRLVDRIESGGVPGLSSRRDLFVDDIHLNDLGNYFIALVQFATVYRRSPVGLTAQTRDRFGAAFEAPSAELARAMQEIAWDAVRNDPRAGF
jgi:hypothetical protein